MLPKFFPDSEQMFKPFALARRVKVLVYVQIKLLDKNSAMGIHLGFSDKRGHTCVADKRGAQILRLHMLGNMGCFLISHNTDDFQLI